MPKEIVEIVIEGFSGPLDLLCHLVENRQMQASKIKMTQLVRIYGAYLSKTKKASMDTLSEFFFMMARLLLHKTLSLLPTPLSTPEGLFEESTSGDADLEISGEELLERLTRYRPYRLATAWLEERKTRENRYYRRTVPKEEAYQGEPTYDIGDLYFLSRVWWGLLEKKAARPALSSFASEDEDIEEEWDGMPEALPEESQIQSRIAELENKLAVGSQLSLNVLWALSPSVKVLVVTLLAVLEMCRMGKVTIEQDALFSDVRILAKDR
ncbi:MAG: segregation/condensation protein A [Synergistaceae bacterium]|jgi:segregation and condensation protein A|nr:segregation/condensation protein A [Synergistaceae bacterium]